MDKNNIQITNISDIDNLMKIKSFIDSVLIEHGDIDKEMELEQYMNDYVLLDKTYLYKEKTIPFNIVNIYDNIIVFTSENTDDIYVKRLIKHLFKYNFDLSRLKHVSINEISEYFPDFTQTELFLLNDEYYTFVENVPDYKNLVR